jgi:hypothetical protein
MYMLARIATLADSVMSDEEGSPRTLRVSSLLLTEEFADVDQEEVQPRTRKRKAQDHLEQEAPRRKHTAIRLHNDTYEAPVIHRLLHRMEFDSTLRNREIIQLTSEYCLGLGFRNCLSWADNCCRYNGTFDAKKAWRRPQCHRSEEGQYHTGAN